jgi:hypothetical protein
MPQQINKLFISRDVYYMHLPNGPAVFAVSDYSIASGDRRQIQSYNNKSRQHMTVNYTFIYSILYNICDTSSNAIMFHSFGLDQYPLLLKPIWDK